MLMREECKKDDYNIIKYDNIEHTKEYRNKVDIVIAIILPEMRRYILFVCFCTIIVRFH